MNTRFIAALVMATAQYWCSTVAHSQTTIFSLKNGIVFTDADSTAELTLRFRVQNLAVFQTRSASDLTLDRLQWNVRRLRIRLNGFLADPSVQFVIQLSMSRNDMDWDNSEFPSIVRDAMVFWQPNDHWRLGFGLGKLPGNRQRVVSSGEMQMIDRSIVNAAFNVDRDFGFHIVYSNAVGGMVYNLRGAVTTGDGRNTVVPNVGLSYTGRAELLPFGAFTRGGDYVEGDVVGEETPKLSLAAGYSQNNNARRTGGQIGTALFDERSMATWIADAVFKYQGFSLYGEYCSREALGAPPITSDATGAQRFVFDGVGVLVQAGYFVGKHVELVARYAQATPRASIEALAQQDTQYTIGVNYYLNGHRVKVQADVSLDNRMQLRTKETTRSWIARFQVELGI